MEKEVHFSNLHVFFFFTDVTVNHLLFTVTGSNLVSWTHSSKHVILETLQPYEGLMSLGELGFSGSHVNLSIL